MQKISFTKLGVLSVFLTGLALVFSLAGSAAADSNSVDFENPPYTLGVIDGQDGWQSDGAAGSGCAVYDHAVGDSFGTTGFGDQSLRISNAVVSGCFGDQTFAKPLADAVGEADSTNGSFSPGTLQSHFEMEFDVASADPDEKQEGLFVSVSPDRGDGSRMSYVGFGDTDGGINMIFYDVQGTDNPANFVPTDLGTYDRTVPHTVKLTMDLVDGPSNDVVKVYVDGVLKHTGTSWENYYRYDAEANAEQSPRIVKTVIFRTGGAAAPNTVEKGFLFDNLSLLSETPEEIPDVTLHFIKAICPAYGDIAGNEEAQNNDDTAGNFVDFNNYDPNALPVFPSPYGFEPVNPSEIPAECDRAAGWSFELFTGPGKNNVQVVGPTDGNGEIEVPLADLSEVLRDVLLANEQVWVSEIEQGGDTTFGALRCFTDALNGDNLEFIRLGRQLPSDVYCIAYNVDPQDEVEDPGRLVFRKQTISGDGTFDFSGDLGDFSIETTNIGSIYGFGEKVFENLAPGAYTVVEDLPAGWSIHDISCNGETPEVVNGNSLTLTIDPGRTTSCTFTNRKDKPGRITIIKNTIGGNSTFDFSGELGAFSLTTVGGKKTKTFVDVVPGVYTVSEGDALGWDLASLKCTDQTHDTVIDAPNQTVDIAVAPGETVECIFTNRKVPAN